MDPRMGSQLDPFQRPDWRWQLAVDLVERAGQPFQSCKDRGVGLAKSFWHSWLKCRHEADVRLLALRMPVVYRAFTIYDARGGITRHALEARILSNEPANSIAAKAGTTPETVLTFEYLFYDVRRRLSSPDYVFNQVIGPRLRDGTTAWDYELVWKFFGFIGGPTVLDELMDTCRGMGRPVNLPQVATFLSEDARCVVRRQLAIAARALRAGDQQTARNLIRADAQRARGKEDQDSPNALEQHIQALVEELPWMVGTDAEKRTPPELAVYDDSAAELNAAELLKVASGEKLPDLEALKAMKLPAPRADKRSVLLGGEDPLS